MSADNQPLRRIGAVLGLTHKQALIWINGVTPEEGQWIDLKWLPPILHNMSDEATFDVWLYEDEPIERGAYRPQEHSALARVEAP